MGRKKPDTEGTAHLHATARLLEDVGVAKVVHEVVDALRASPRQSGRVSWFGGLLDRYFRVPGFTHTTKAPAAILERRLEAAIKGDPGWARATAHAWLETRPELRDDVKAFLARRPLPCQVGGAPAGAGASKPNADAEAIVKAIRGHAQVYLSGGGAASAAAEPEVCLAMAVLVQEPGNEASPGDGSLTPGDAEADRLCKRFTGWLNDLAALSPDAEEWKEVPALIDRLQQLAEVKVLEAATALRERLQRAVDDLRTEFARDLALFDGVRPDSWEPRAVADDAVGVVMQLVGEARDCLSRYSPLARQLDEADSVATRRNLRREMDELESRLGQLLADLNEKLTRGSPPEPEGSGSSEEGLDVHAAEEDAGETAEADTGAGADQGSLQEAGTDTRGATSPGTESESADSAVKDDSNGSPPDDAEAPRSSDGEPEAIVDAGSSGTCGEPARDEPYAVSLWKRVRVGDIPGAYWLAKALEAEGRESPVKADLLKALQGSLWLDCDSPLAAELAALVRTFVMPADACSASLALAASLKPSLIAPHSGMLGWLQAAQSAGAALGLHGVCHQVQDFANHNIAIRPEDVTAVADKEARVRHAKKVAQSLAGWLEDAPSQQSPYQRASQVWRLLIRPSGSLYRMLRPAAANERHKVGQVRQGLARWRDESAREAEIGDALLSLRPSGRKPRIEASARDWLNRRIDDACAMAEAWCDAAEVAELPAESMGWRREMVKTLREGLDPQLRAALAALGEQALATDSLPQQAILSAVRAAVLDVARLLDLPAAGQSGAGGAAPTEGVHWPDRHWWLQGRVNLDEALARRLLWLPGLPLTEHMQPEPEALTAVRERLTALGDLDRPISEVIEGWLEVEDYRFVDDLLSAVQPAEERERLTALVKEREARSRERVNAALAEVRDALDSAVGLGEVKPEDRAQLMRDVDRLAGGGGRKVATNVRNLGACHAALESVRATLDALREEHVRQIETEWASLRERVQARFAAAGSEIDDRAAEVIQFVDERLAAHDTVVAQECMAELRRSLETDGLPEMSQLGTVSVAASVFSDWTSAIPAIREWMTGLGGGLGLLKDAALRGRRAAGFNYGRLSTPRREEAVDAIDAWATLKKASPPSPRLAEQELPRLFRYLGFDLIHEAGKAVEVKESKAEWLRARVSMTAGGLARPIPQFGSRAGNKYDVLCVWKRPGMESLVQRLHGEQPAASASIVLYFGHLSDSQRRELLAASRRDRVPAAVMDETLFVYLSRSFDVRLPAFLACALPYTALNPYTPHVAGNVPPEVYYGRDDMVREIESQTGGCLVYGGRQLGKSALLRHVERRFHNPEAERFAAVREIKNVGDEAAGVGTREIWRHLHKVFQDFGFIQTGFRRPEAIQELISQVMGEAPERRVLVLFDEADHFLDADAQAGFVELGRLKSLMEESDRRFKVVFAGLHNVRRFESLPNQPLAHLGSPIQVGPLDVGAARKLVREPLEMLGFRLPDSSVWRILSYTNYHPGLVQLFCSMLVERLHSGASQVSPPAEIPDDLIEEVYREVGDKIRERFDWTLSLDPRYQATVWTMVLAEAQQGAQQSPGHSLEEVRRLLAEWGVFPARSLPSPDEMDSLLEELCGLGVLVRLPQRRYALRSPNIVHLLGSKEDIESRLLSLMEAVASAPGQTRDSLHRWLEDVGGFSPLTHVQEARAFRRESGVCLVHGSAAVHMDRLRVVPKALLDADDDGRVAVRDLEIDGASPDVRSSVRRWLERFAKQHAMHSGRLVTAMLTSDKATSLADALSGLCEALEGVGRRGASGDGWTRVVVVAGPEATWRWLQEEDERRAELERCLDAVVVARPLDETGVGQRLGHAEVVGGHNLSSRLTGDLGGWPWLIDRFVERTARGSDPEEVLGRLVEELRGRRSPVRQGFVRALGLRVHESIGRVVAALAHGWGDGSLSESEVLEVLPEEAALPVDECQRVIEFLRRMGCVPSPPGEPLALDPLVSWLYAG